MALPRTALAAIVLSVLAIMCTVGGPRRTELMDAQLREDVTSPGVKSQFLSKFHVAKAHHASKARSNVLFDPLAVVKDKGGKKKLTAAQKAAIAAKMKALREKILGDFSSNTKFGKRVDCSYPYPAASCKENAVPPPRPGADPAADAIPMAFGKA